MAKPGLWWRKLQGNLLFLYFKFVSITSQYRVEGEENLAEARQSHHPLLWTFWHGQAMPFMSYSDHILDGQTFSVITVGDERGDTLTTLGDRIGAEVYPVDMKGGSFASGRALLNVIQAMKRGKQSLIAPDGPDGPAYVPKQGLLYLARKAHAVILPTGIWTYQAYLVRRWDSYQVPLPFAKINVVIGKPIFVEPSNNNEALLNRISQALHLVRYRAQVLAGVRPWR